MNKQEAKEKLVNVDRAIKHHKSQLDLLDDKWIKCQVIINAPDPKTGRVMSVDDLVDGQIVITNEFIMNDLDIRISQLDPSTRIRIKELSITSGDYSFIDLISRGFNTSSLLSVSLDISIQSASTRLSTLRNKGYLARKKIKQESGGYEFVYHNIYKLTR